MRRRKKHACERGGVIECQVAVTAFLISPILTVLIPEYGGLEQYLHLMLVLLGIAFYLRLSLCVSPESSSAGGDSYLCRHCGIEVEGFDHHCNYMNRCIGKKNYHTFLSLLATLATLECLQFYIAFTCLHDRGLLQEKSCVLAALVSAPLAAATFGILCFHSYLRLYLRTNTYNWILDRRRKALEAQIDAENRAFLLREADREEARSKEYEYWRQENRRTRPKASTDDPENYHYGHVELSNQNVSESRKAFYEPKNCTFFLHDNTSIYQEKHQDHHRGGLEEDADDVEAEFTGLLSSSS